MYLMSQNVLLSHWKVFCAILLLFLLITHNLFLRFRVFNISVNFPFPPLRHMLFCCVHNGSQFSPTPICASLPANAVVKDRSFRPNTNLSRYFIDVWPENDYTNLTYNIKKRKKKWVWWQEGWWGGKWSETDKKQERQKIQIDKFNFSISSCHSYFPSRLCLLSTSPTLDNAPSFDPRTSEYPILLFGLKCPFFLLSHQPPTPRTFTNICLYLYLFISMFAFYLRLKRNLI